MPGEVVQAISEHHERFDGKGYPKGLKGDSISFAGRCLAIADCYSALVTRRNDRPFCRPFRAMKILTDQKESFDPTLLEILFSLIKSQSLVQAA